QVQPDRVEVHDRFTLRGLGHWARSEDIGSLVISHERLDRLAGRWLQAGPTLRRVVDASNRGLAENFDTVVCTTDWAAEEFRRLDAPNLVQVPLGVDLAGFSPANYDEDLRARLTPRGEALIVSAVRLSSEKAPMRVVDTVRELLRRGRRVKAVVAGDGLLRSKLEKAAAGLPITFAGFLHDRAELGRLLATADVVVAPGPIETFGLAALEALASGTPVVVDSASALPEVIGSAGFAVPGKPESFAGAVETLLEVSRERARNAARDRAECFPWSATIDGFLAAHGLTPQRVRERVGAGS
ncbi:MAG TPA: glycosyltransferase, partial [Sporichthya sp.]|nr:glycosyltransferase [Sporichthya sp.]